MVHCRRRYSGGVLLPDGKVVVFVPYDSERIGEPPWRQPRGKSMVSSVNSHTPPEPGGICGWLT